MMLSAEFTGPRRNRAVARGFKRMAPKPLRLHRSAAQAHPKKTTMTRGRKILLIVVCIVVAFIVAASVIAPRLMQVDRYRPEVISLIEQKTGRQVSMSRLGLTVFPVIEITVDNLALSNPAGFPAGNWLTIKRIKARLDARALFDRQIVIRSLDLSQPTVALLEDSQGHWNYAAPQAGAGPQPADPPPGVSERPQDRPSSSHGDPPLFSLQQISGVTLEQGSLTMANVLPGGISGPASVEADGISGAFKNIQLSNTQAGVPLPAGASGQLAVKTLHADGLVATGLSSPVEVLPAEIKLTDVKFGFYRGKGEGVVTLNLAGPALAYAAQGNLSGVDAAELLAQFPAARGQMTGTAACRFTLASVSTRAPGALAGLEGEGTLTVRQGRVPNLHLDKTLLELANVAQIKAASGDPSAFSLIEIDWRLDHGLLTTPSVKMTGNGINVEGAGSIGVNPPQRLNYAGVAHLAAATNPLTNLLAGISGVSFSNGQLNLPFTLSGTFSKPVFRLKQTGREGFVNSLAKPAQAPQALQDILKLFQRKK